jgi:mannose-6-phosphate isomerase-like protein (cupin superfamily)
MKADLLEQLARLGRGLGVDEAATPRFVEALRHGSMWVELYVPHEIDRQQPHAHDELYFIARGRATLVMGDPRAPTHHAAAPGDVLFVPAQCWHHFEDFSDDFATWAVFYGPTGGEARPPAPPPA